MKSAHSDCTKNRCVLTVGCDPVSSTSCITECCALAFPSLPGHGHLMGAGRSPRIHLAHNRELREGIPLQARGDTHSRPGQPTRSSLASGGSRPCTTARKQGKF